MERDSIYLMVGALTAAALVLGYFCYQERQKTSGVEISVGHNSISVEKK